jgi:NAD(P)H-hydrate epimerase
MMYVTVKEMKELDRIAIEEHGILASRLMENAGRAVADNSENFIKKGETFVFSGYGNNGGDGFVAARHLLKKGFNVRVFLVGKPKDMTPEAAAHLKSLKKMKVFPVKIAAEEDIARISRAMKKPDVIIDAIFGIGVKGPLDSFYSGLIGVINSLNVPVVAVDVPSGLDADTGRPLGCAIKAARTVTLGLPKAGFKSAEAKDYVGELIVADIGLPTWKKRRLY